jgi:hypothetical protein
VTSSVVHQLGRFKCGTMDGVRQGSEPLADTEADSEFVQRRQVAGGVRQGAEHLVDTKAESVQRTELDPDSGNLKMAHACIGELQVTQRAAGSGREEADQPLDGLGVETDVGAEPRSCRRRRTQRDGEALLPSATIHGSLRPPRAKSRWPCSSASRSGGERAPSMAHGGGGVDPRAPKSALSPRRWTSSVPRQRVREQNAH